MIPLRLAAETDFAERAIVGRLVSNAALDKQSSYGMDYVFDRAVDGWSEFTGSQRKLRIRAPLSEVDGDVIMIAPGAKSAHRLIRAGSCHNSLLVTEQCDQLCVMCSQPPKANHVDLFDAFLRACLISPTNAVIGITGGEPLLHKTALFALLSQVHAERSDIRFHVLTNGQHFAGDDVGLLNSVALQNVLWAIPIYAPDQQTHDRIVGKAGAFERLVETFVILSHTTAQIELRTVVMRANCATLPNLADFLTSHVPFAAYWSIMQMERIGYGKMNWEREFLDTSVQFGDVARALCIAQGRGLDARLFNFPLCTVPKPYRHFALPSISDWKMKFEKFCVDCEVKGQCGGFFQWHDQTAGYAKVGLHEGA